ncbi:Tetratricopeptide repeat-containing protein [Candidatus Electronema halotolerans]|jgi:outer membrane protein assembly factor BamD (BamD/ComL family)
MSLSSAAVRNLLLLGLAAPLLLNGCLPSGRTERQLHPDSRQDSRQPEVELPAPPPAPQKPAISRKEQAAYEKQVLEPALATINGRVTSYEQKLQDWQKLGSSQETLRLSPAEIEQLIVCRNTVAGLLEDYKGLQEQLLQTKSIEASRELLFTSLQEFKGNDLVYLEGDCPKLFEDFNSPARQRAAAEAAPPEQTAVEPLPAAQDDSSSEAVQKEDLGGQYKHDLALLRAGQRQKARRLFTELLAKARQQENQKLAVKVLAMLADLDFASRDYAAARLKYEELRRTDSSSDRYGRQLAALAASVTKRDELDAYADLLLNCLTYNPDEDGFTVVQQAAEFMRLFPDSLLMEDADRLSQQISKEAEQWFADLLQKTEQWRAAGKEQAAAGRLEQVPLDILPLDKQELLRQKKEELLAAIKPATAEDASFAPDHAMQEAVPAPLPDPDDALQDLWDKGMLVLQQGKYDEAVSLFSKLSGTSFAVKAEAKIEEAERLAAEELRKKAAELFQEADSATEPAVKQALLRSSKKLLEDILRKYPHSGMEDKVRRNLNSVDKELAQTGKG